MTINFSDVGKTIIYAGLLDENNVASVSIDCSSVLNQYPGSSATMLVQLPSGNEAFPVYCVFDNGVITHTFTEAELQTPGMGKLAVMVSTQDGAILKRSHTAFLMIGDALTPGGTVPPSIMEEWIIWAGEALTEARNSRDAAAASEADAEDAAQRAHTSKESAAASATAAQTAQIEAEAAQASASASATNAGNSASEAALSATAARSAQTAAEAAQVAAEAAESIVEGHAAAAQTAQTAAEAAQSAAEAAQTAAEAAAETASSKTSVKVGGTAQQTVEFDSDPQTQLDTLASGLSGTSGEMAVIAPKVTHNEKILHNVTDLLKGHAYSMAYGESPAYVQSVPVGAQTWAGIGMIGGRSVGWNQRINPSWLLSRETYGITFTADTVTGKMTAVGTGTWSSEENYIAVYFMLGSEHHLDLKAGHKYLLTSDLAGKSETHCLEISNFEPMVTEDTVYTAAADITTGILKLRVEKNVEIDDEFYPQLFDLTQMFGAGNEPETAAAFRAMFPDSHYPYDTGSILSAKVDKVISADGDHAAVQEFMIPAEVQALDGYGWSAGEVYNYVDFAEKKYHTKVGRIDLGTLAWNAPPEGSAAYVGLSRAKYRGAILNANGWKNNTSGPSGQTMNYGEIGITNSESTPLLRIKDHAFDGKTGAEIRTMLSGVYILFELKTETETDISAYLDEYSDIETAQGGTLTFHQSAGTQMPLPNSVGYWVSNYEALEDNA